MNSINLTSVQFISFVSHNFSLNNIDYCHVMCVHMKKSVYHNKMKKRNLGNWNYQQNKNQSLSIKFHGTFIAFSNTSETMIQEFTRVRRLHELKSHQWCEVKFILTFTCFSPNYFTVHRSHMYNVSVEKVINEFRNHLNCSNLVIVGYIGMEQPGVLMHFVLF